MDFEKAAHKTADVLRAVSGKEKYRRTSAVIVAAGNSERMNGQNKQFAELCGIPVLARSVRAFENTVCIDEIVIVTRKNDIKYVIELCEKYGFKKVKAVIPGGENRQASVFAGILEISDKSEFVAIHDGARCLVTPYIIEEVCRAAYKNGAATAATHVHDTVKRSTSLSYIEKTEDREKIWLAQTPQVFGANLYRAAAYTAKEAEFRGTDDCSLAERIEFKTIKLVECGKENIKITEPDDIVFAEIILEARKRREDDKL